MIKKFNDYFLAEGKKIKDDSSVRINKDVEAEVFTSPRQQKGKLETIEKGEEGDVFDLPGGDRIGVQFGDGSCAWINRKYLDVLEESEQLDETHATNTKGAYADFKAAKETFVSSLINLIHYAGRDEKLKGDAAVVEAAELLDAVRAAKIEIKL